MAQLRFQRLGCRWSRFASQGVGWWNDSVFSTAFSSSKATIVGGSRTPSIRTVCSRRSITVRATMSPLCGADPDRHRRAKGERRDEADAAGVGLGGIHLGLPHGEGERRGGRVVDGGDLELGMAGLVDPLRPEPAEALAGGVEHRLAEVVAGGGAVGVAGEIAVDRRPEPLGAQVLLQHLQHQRALGIDDVGVVGRERRPAARVAARGTAGTPRGRSPPRRGGPASRPSTAPA